ncbi:MFS transporter [Fictibacillus barbaricus]|uniref:MFS transporter n=1 Tax=Fictibacillus barbaricus TaxID=182136 RepID=A0ABS2Z904_9BACL|nr:MFS transporter [Fictibacillus barbaricus]MBN3544649.1 MFS transporter [Fictibacillus barbaricus]GGB65066.1 permease [Fictibacillus barbaricus]
MIQANRNFHYLWSGQTLGNLGDILYIICLISLVYNETGSVLHMALIPFVKTMSLLVSGFIAPIFIEKYKRTTLLFTTLTAKTILLFGLCLITLYGIDTTFTYALLYVLIVIISLLEGIGNPARRSMVPDLVEEQELVRANSFISVANQTSMLLAWPLGSVLLVVWGEQNMLWLTVVLFLLSSILTYQINLKETMINESQESKWLAMREGWELIFKSRKLTTLTAMDVLENFGHGVWIAAILYVYVETAIGKGEAWWGYINAAFFAGMMIAGIVVYRFSNRFESHLSLVIMTATLCLLGLNVWFGLTSSPWVALMVSFIFGFPQMARDVSQNTLIQQTHRDKQLAKVYASHGTLVYGTFGLATLVLGWFAEEFGVRATYILVSTLFLFSFLIAFINREVLHSDYKKEPLKQTMI